MTQLTVSARNGDGILRSPVHNENTKAQVLLNSRLTP